MGKKQVMITIDEKIHEQARLENINISSISEKAVYEKLKITKQNIPESLKKIHCSLCSIDCDEDFFYCKEGQKIICINCHKNFDMVKHCLSYYDKNGEHMHIRIPGHEDQNFKIKQEVENG